MTITIRNAFAAALAVTAAATSMLVASDADARGRGRGVYVQTYDLAKPDHGYEGRTTFGYYCSYKRLPKRACSPTANGESCKIVGWTLEQMCY